MSTIKTIIHAYKFNTKNADEAAAWGKLKSSLKASHPHCMHSHGGKLHYMPEFDNKTLELETEHLFSNQWNTAPIGNSNIGLRVFDWALDYEPNRNKYVMQGHYLEQTDEMREARRNRMACGYCGKQEPAQKGYVFCHHCLDSEYLKSTELHLLRMQTVDAPFPAKRAPLAEAESAHLLPLYKHAQLHGNSARGVARIAAERLSLVKSRDEAINHANIEHDGFIWCLNRGLKTDDLIYYKHTGRFCFGWRSNGVDLSILSEILDAISEFPFPYDIICADGRKLSGG